MDSGLCCGSPALATSSGNPGGLCHPPGLSFGLIRFPREGVPFPAWGVHSGFQNTGSQAEEAVRCPCGTRIPFCPLTCPPVFLVVPCPLPLPQVSSLSEPLQSTSLLLALVGSAGHSHCSTCGPTYPKLLVRPVSELLGVLFHRQRLPYQLTSGLLIPATSVTTRPCAFSPNIKHVFFLLFAPGGLSLSRKSLFCHFHYSGARYPP